MAGGQYGCFTGSRMAANAGGGDQQQGGKTLQRHMPKSTDKSGRLGRRTTTHGEQSDGAGQRTSQIKVVLGFIKDFPGHGRFFPRSCGVRISDVGALALALAFSGRCKPPPKGSS